jgi:hypothetical protein
VHQFNIRELLNFFEVNVLFKGVKSLFSMRFGKRAEDTARI